MPIEAPDRRLILGGALAAAVLALYAFSPGAPTAEIPPAPTPAPAAPPATAPPPLPAPAPSAPAPDLQGLRLHGLAGAGAIIGYADGRQRLVAVGREVLPGLRLREVRRDLALLESSSGLVELRFAGPEGGAPIRTAAAPAPAAAASGDRREETLRYRLGLAPRRASGRITGFTLRPDVEMPLLRRAGLRPGDVLIGVNGQPFDSGEKVMELANEIAGSYTAEFEYERGGRTLRASLPVNPRRP